MKNARSKKILVMLLAFILVLSALSPCVAFAAGTQPSVLDVVSEYMDARHVLLSTGDTSDLEDIAVAAMVTDELAHRQLLVEKNITLPNVRYVIDSVNAWDNYILVEMREIEEVVFIGQPSFEVSHTILIMLDDNQNPLVVSDNYMEGLSGFESCSYVPEYIEPDTERDAAAVNRTNCFLYVANEEVGYQEGANMATKYGTWAGSPDAAWCASFVTWCANRAGVSIPRTAYVPTLVTHFKYIGRYYRSSAQGGNYTPRPGDIFFTTGENHTGIVYSVSSSYMTVIDGNWNGKVAKRNIALADSDLIGFGRPEYNSVDHIGAEVDGVYRCTNCGAIISNNMASF